MALANLTELQASLAGWLHRSDVNTTATGAGVDNIVDDWIALFEAEANATLRLRVMESQEALVTVAGSRYVALPATYLEPIELRILWQSGITPQILRYVPAEQLDQSPVTSRPINWAIDGTNIAFDCVADAAYPLGFRMLKRFGLTDALPTNWLLTNYPNVYLYGCLRHSSLYLMQDARAAAWDRAYAQALQQLEDWQARTNTLATLSVDPALLMGRGTNGFNVFSG